MPTGKETLLFMKPGETSLNAISPTHRIGMLAYMSRYVIVNVMLIKDHVQSRDFCHMTILQAHRARCH